MSTQEKLVNKFEMNNTIVKKNQMLLCGFVMYFFTTTPFSLIRVTFFCMFV